jgi:hypothetical protein
VKNEKLVNFLENVLKERFSLRMMEKSFETFFRGRSSLKLAKFSKFGTQIEIAFSQYF